jgi:hypothetical protein
LSGRGSGPGGDGTHPDPRGAPVVGEGGGLQLDPLGGRVASPRDVEGEGGHRSVEARLQLAGEPPVVRLEPRSRP